jgi:hypothetical protein
MRVYLCPSKVQDLVTPPELNEARARKCILALGAAKLTRNDNSTVCSQMEGRYPISSTLLGLGSLLLDWFAITLDVGMRTSSQYNANNAPEGDNNGLWR